MGMAAPDDRYNPIYAGLSEVRELFHRDGRLNDSNQKLDETVKLMAIHYAAARGIVDSALYADCLDESTFSLTKLNALFDRVRNAPLFLSAEGTPLFEHSPNLAFHAQESDIAFKLFRTLASAGLGGAPDSGNLDFMNEAFGHFVRDNFRNHIEDAQYLTPPEVVDFMVSLGRDLLKQCRENTDSDLIVMDPSCGVGSFLTAFHHTAQRNGAPAEKVHYVGQDKVERMARLAALNYIFSDTDKYEVHIGNAIYDDSPISRWNGKVDLILTNPPFGARFSISDLKKRAPKNIGFYTSMKSPPGTIDSEYVFLQRYVSLLKEGGICLAVVPDGVISAKGPGALARHILLRSARLIGVVELPAVTFAQAGTRAKTAILMFQKRAGHNHSEPVFFGEVHGLGFEVSKRKGVPIKRSAGTNQLPDLLENWQQKTRPASGNMPPGAWVTVDLKSQDTWTPRSILFRTGNEALQKKGSGRKLSDLVEGHVRRKTKRYHRGCHFISVLHVIGEGLLDIRAMNEYQPVTPGIPVSPGEVLVSRINPRIPRVLVVPELRGEILCSAEFEVLTPRAGVNPYKLAYLLLSSSVQAQLQSLTAGTSASHSRIKAEKMYEVLLPWPDDTAAEREMAAYEHDVRAIFEHTRAIAERRARLNL